MIVEVEREERYWYPDEGGIVWLAGFQPVAPDGRYLGREAPELAAAGLRIAGVAGAARHHGEALASDAAEPGRPLELRRDPDNPHDPNAIAVHAGGEQVGWVPRAIAEEIAPALDAGRALQGARAARAAGLAARPAHGPDDAARRRALARAARTLRRAMPVDAWMQHPTQRFLRHDMFASLRRWTGGELPQDEIPIDVTLAAMDAGGVSYGLLSAWHGPEGPMIANDEVAGWVAAHPERFGGLAAVDLRDPVRAVRELRRCVAELGFKGLRVIPWLWGLPPNDRRYYPLYAECVELGVPFCTQVGHTGPLRSSETGRPIPYLDDVALDFPDLVIVGGHIGYPWTEEMVALARKYPNVYIDTSAYTARRYPPELVRYLRADGRRKVLFGSELPDDPARPRRSSSSTTLELDDEARELFLEGNARRVFAL